MNKDELIEHYEAIEMAAGSVKEIWDVFKFADNEFQHQGTPIRHAIAALIGSILMVRLKVFSDEYVRFNNFYRKPSEELSQKMSEFRKLLKEYNVEKVRNILIAHNRDQRNGNKLTNTEDLEKIKMAESHADYLKLVLAMAYVMVHIQKTMQLECPDYKPEYKSHKSKYR